MAQRQISLCHSETKDYLLGAKGVGLIGGRRGTEISGAESWHYGGPESESDLFGKMYRVGHVEVVEAIRNGKPVNDGEHMCKTTLMAIMGRMADYTGQEITWEQ